MEQITLLIAKYCFVIGCLVYEQILHYDVGYMRTVEDACPYNKT